MSNNSDIINNSLNNLINQLASELSGRFIVHMEDYLNKIEQRNPKKILITSKELSNLLSLSPSTIVKLRKDGMPSVKIGDAVRFDIEECKNWINQNLKTEKDENSKL